MSDEVADKDKKGPEGGADAKPEEKAKSGGMPILMVAALVGGVLGGATGGMVLAPRMTSSHSSALTAASSASKNASKEKSEKGGKSGPAEDRIFRLDNVIVNPAGSEGTRFLMTSIAFQVQDEASENALKAHEVELRDQVIGKLEAMSMPMLMEVHARDSLKAQLADAAISIVGPHEAVTVFLPQFVIQ